MENQKYNSLTDKLIQNGIIQSPSEQEKNISSGNFFKEMKSEIIPEESFDVPQINQTPSNELKALKNKKRINEYDLELIKNIGSKTQSKNLTNPIDIVKRFLDFKNSSLNNGNASVYELFLYKFCPRIYRAKLIKKAIKKMLELNLDAKSLLDKTIPYGEGESRYEDLVKYLNYANELQTKLKKKFN